MSKNDTVRQKILKFFYDRNDVATSRCGKLGSAIKILDLKSALKKVHGLTGNEVQSNLTFLIDMGWINTFDKQAAFQTANGSIMPSVTTWYEISATGIKKIEGESEFDQSLFGGINIGNLESSVVNIGNHNLVNVKYQKTFELLESLGQKAATSKRLNDQEKTNFVADIQTLQKQLIKPAPDKNIVGTAWEAIKNTATVIGLGNDITQLAPLIADLMI